MTVKRLPEPRQTNLEISFFSRSMIFFSSREI